MRAHVVENGVIVNTIEVESLSVLPNLVAAQGNEGIGWREFHGTFLPPTVVLDRAKLANEIDSFADALRLAVVGDALRVEEYRLAQEEADAYIKAGYTGTVPGTVQSWATAKGWTAKQSADDIAATAQKWTTALYTIRAIRLAGKEAVKSAATDALATSTHTNVLGQLQALKGAL